MSPQPQTTPLPRLSLHSATSNPLMGTVTVPGDKSISHRSLILASQVLGNTLITGLLEGEDVIRTAQALQLMGVKIERKNLSSWSVQGVGVGGLSEPQNILDMGNSGTGARLMMGLVAPYEFTSFFTGDDSLRSRPMKRVMLPLTEMGARFSARDGGKLPLALHGTTSTLPIHYTLPVASAQVKSALLLAALNTKGITTITEPEATRDHTERMLRHLGWAIEIIDEEQGGKTIRLQGYQEIAPQSRTLSVPGDPSSAAFLVVAALIVPGSSLILPHVCVNTLRTGLYVTLKEMGADIRFENTRISAGEEVADIHVKYSLLKGITVPASRAPSMIDEYPILAIAAAFAQGDTIMAGLAELKVKESDRLKAIADGLSNCGVKAEVGESSLTVKGSGSVAGGGTVTTHFDHRIAMSFLVMGMASQKPVIIDDGTAITTSFPGFSDLLNQFGAHIETVVQKTSLADYAIGKNRALTIAIDGPASSGKGTLARRLAEHLDYAYLDTGSIYRAVGLKLIYSGKDPFDKRAAIDASRSLTEQDLANPRLRQERIGKAASIVSAIPEVRSILLDFQRRFSRNPRGAVLDGRDIGTIVCPTADVKIFITANLETRAKRRHRELQGEGVEVIYESVYEDLRERDERDSQRNIAPLVPSSDAIIMDTSNQDAATVFAETLAVVSHYRETGKLLAKKVT